MAGAASRIVVIGAGSAGISAARTLQEHGEKAIVLEARSRVGGRAWSDSSTFGFPVDMGCAWLHSADLNPWTRYAREQGFTLIERSPIWQRRIGRNETTPEQRDAWFAAFQRNERLIAEAVRAGRDVAVADVVPQDRYRPLFDGVMTWLMGTDSDKVSTLDYDRYQDSDRNWAVTEGLGSVIAHAARDLDVRLDTPAQTIDWQGPRVRITTPRGDLEADAVIVTVPTTVLAEETAIRFSPALPPAYRDAFQGVPLGLANKVFFQMEPGTLPFDDSVNMVGTDQTVRTAAYQTRPSGHEVMMAYFGGSLARELEQSSQLESFAREQLSDIFGADFVRHIRRTLQTGWATDRWSRGAYSAALPGKARMREWLNEPVADRIFFAGEACSIEYFGTVHGARLSGTAAAKRALRLSL
jgi:monoamine oxidase